MPLTMATLGESIIIKKIGGKEETKQFLSNLGFIRGSVISVVTEINGNLIVQVKDSRIAISKEMALKISV